MNQDELVLNVDDLCVQFIIDGVVVEAVNGVTFQVKKGKTVGLVGETGAGKTTTAKAIMHLIPDPPGKIQRGQITLCGKDVLSMSKKDLEQIRGVDVAMIFQDPMTALNPVYTVGEQIAESIAIHEHMNQKEAFAKAQEMLEIVGIPASRADDYPHQFSGGMKQRVVIAMALACNPKLLIADEPTTALDVTIQAQVLDLMRNLREKYNMAMIMITHDLGIVAEICDEVAVMYAGKIIEQGTLEDVFNNTKHPYTEGLFNSLPNINNRQAELKPIPGLMPDPSNLPKGCAFAPRCPYATAACEEKQPSLHVFGEDHSVLCTAYDAPDFRIERGMQHG